ncbi:MAG: 4-hydroxybenzoate--CoA/benzoate--CoA ligase [Paracidovorax wautersii]|uniref:4-hydroxybenzoate--CoA/benzoate--CoA ligase n=1 Tax=Paracidovorax wautersii TaxID=1177982 RepID=A0A7V8FR64_9BURK|nr:MAG: 4-hydroxybenzoate--CoA/benzoate--CoA ligase [Paracidovorax wautersii]
MTWLSLEDYLAQPVPGRSVAEGWPHARLRQQALVLAGALRASGVQRLAVHLADAAELTLVLLAAWRAGIPVILPADLQRESLVALAQQATLLFLDAPASASTDAPVPGLQMVAWRDWLAQQPSPQGEGGLDGDGLAADDTALMVRTSGSSGQAKVIAKTLRQLQCEIEVLESLRGGQAAQAQVIGSVSAQHVYGLTFRVLWPLMAGRLLGRTQIVFPEDLLAASGQGAVVWIGSPALYKRMTDSIAWEQAAGRVRLAFSAGGPLPAHAAQQLQGRLGDWPVEIYGSSETGAIGWRRGLGDWQTLPGVEVGLQAPASPDAPGALWVRSPWLPPGQVEQTSDAASIVAGGFVLGDRLDRIVKLEDKRIGLAHIESALARHPWIDDVRCGVYQAGRAQIGCVAVLSASGLHVLRNQGRAALVRQLGEHLRDHVEPIAWPRRWRWVRGLPLSPQGKLPQAWVNTLLATERPRQPELLAREQAADGSGCLRLAIPPDLVFFSGHFPQAPVVPGVVQIEWARAWAGELWRLAFDAQEFEVLKFQRLMRPGDEVDLRLSHERGKLYFSYHGAQGICSSGRIVLPSPVADGLIGDAHA